MMHSNELILVMNTHFYGIDMKRLWIFLRVPLLLRETLNATAHGLLLMKIFL